MTRKVIVVCLTACFIGVGSCGADVIDFAGLTNSNGTPYTSSIEGNFTVAVNTGEWLEAHLNGNPIPDIFGRSSMGSVDVTENTTGFFTFYSVDLDDGSAGGFTYQINGYLNSANVLSFGGAFPGGNFPTIFSPDHTQALDTLNIQINSTTSSYNIDNIVVNTVPEPASVLALAALGTYCLAGPRRSRPGS